MVRRCPNCSQLTFFGRPQVLGELVVCPRCEAVFGCGDEAPVQHEHDERHRTPGKTDNR
jgi:hypothetical protein